MDILRLGWKKASASTWCSWTVFFMGSSHHAGSSTTLRPQGRRGHSRHLAELPATSTSVRQLGYAAQSSLQMTAAPADI